MTLVPARHEAVLREAAPAVLSTLVRRHGQFAACEDAVQEAVIAALRQWPVEGIPREPQAWLVTVAGRRFIDAVRSDRARRRRESVAAADSPEAPEPEPGIRLEVARGEDPLILLLLCCHPSLTPSSQIALTLRAVGGLTTAQIARAFLVPEATMAQRISRAKQRIAASGARFEPPRPAERAARLAAVLHVLYLVFAEGHTASGGPDLLRAALVDEAIRLTRRVHHLLPEDGEVAGLLALMLLTDAHRDARIGPDGALVPLAEQDRGRWDRGAIAEGIALVSTALSVSPPGPYQLQAAIAAVHAEAPTHADTDWRQIAALYRVLSHLAPNPMVTLNHAAAVAMVDGPRAGLRMLEAVASDPRTAGHHRLAAVRGHLLELDGQLAAARDAYRAAARATTSLPEQRYLQSRAATLPLPVSPPPAR